MREISKKIKEEFVKSKKLSELALGMKYEQSIEVRKEQDKSYKKWLFFKNLNNAMSDNKQVFKEERN